MPAEETIVAATGSTPRRARRTFLSAGKQQKNEFSA